MLSRIVEVAVSECATGPTAKDATTRTARAPEKNRTRWRAIRRASAGGEDQYTRTTCWAAVSTTTAACVISEVMLGRPKKAEMCSRSWSRSTRKLIPEQRK